MLNDANYLSRMRAVLASRPLFLTDHAKGRMKLRKVSSKQIHDCVAKGVVATYLDRTIESICMGAE